MQHALFEVLTGRYSDGSPITREVDAQSIGRSIRDHLTRLLNARKGTLAHMPDYGLTDIAQIYQRLPYSVSELVEVIGEAIEKFEPRLSRVEVTHRPIETGDCVLTLEVRGSLTNGQRVCFSTYFMSGGYADVKMSKRTTEERP